MSAMIPFRPFADILSFDRRFSPVLDNAWAGFPRVDVKDADDHLELVAEVPGVKPESIEVTVDGGILTIAANGDEEKSQTRDGYVWRERRQQSLRRSFRLPRGTSAEQVHASLENGLLTVSVEKAQTPAPARIAITSGKAEGDTPAAEETPATEATPAG